MRRRYVDIDEFLKCLEEQGYDDSTMFRLYTFKKIVDLYYEKHTSEIEESQRLESVQKSATKIVEGSGNTHYYVCSECGDVVDVSFRYCSHCGAKFDLYGFNKNKPKSNVTSTIVACKLCGTSMESDNIGICSDCLNTLSTMINDYRNIHSSTAIWKDIDCDEDGIPLGQCTNCEEYVPYSTYCPECGARLMTEDEVN